MKLRTYQSADADQICRWIQTEEEFYRWSADRYNTYPISGEDIDKNYASQLADGHFYPMTAIDDDGNAIGHFIIRYPDDRNRESVRFGFIIVNPSLRGKGCGKEMLRLGIRFAKENLDVKRIDLGVFAENEKARKCYTAVGFCEYNRRLCAMPIGTWECIDMELYV
jgi:RimJ/RimL family protein N-acetyltransferase|uniref:GNAT family N-acetyltransferase n=1 Tax=Eubacterium cellulosolvens TaxID=29322 RepID=UPI0004803657|nr:GNAT family protein [[Eubacterium] cellulosolvens]